MLIQHDQSCSIQLVRLPFCWGSLLKPVVLTYFWLHLHLSSLANGEGEDTSAAVAAHSTVADEENTTDVADEEDRVADEICGGQISTLALSG